jgi:DNA-binding LacI/PurR family transcriptional regulator
MSSLKIGVITNNQNEVFQSAVLAGIRKVAEDRGYTLVVDSYADDPQHPQPITVHKSDVDGIIVIANAASNELIRQIYANRIPVTLVCHRLPDAPIPVVMSNNVQGVGELVRHLVKGCHRQNLVFIRGLPDQNDGWERELGFRQEVLRCNLRVPESHFVRGDFSAELAAASIRELIQRRESFDGIVAADYPMAIAAIHELSVAGIVVPDQVSVVGFGDYPEAEAAGLTTVAASIHDLGSCAVRQLISQIEGMRITGVTLLNVQLVVRETCGYIAQQAAHSAL